MNTVQTRKDINAVIAKLKELEQMLGTANPQVMQDVSKGLDEQSKKLGAVAAGLKK